MWLYEVALDLSLSDKIPEDDRTCDCIACILRRTNVNAQASKLILRHWDGKCRFRSSSSFPFSFDSRIQEAKSGFKDQRKIAAKDDELHRLAQSLAESQDSASFKSEGSRKRRRISTTSEKSPKHLAQQDEVEAMSSQPTSPLRSSSEYSSPTHGYMRSSPPTNQHAAFPEAYQGTGCNHPPFALDFLTQQQLSVNAWLTVQPNTLSPPFVKSPPNHPSRMGSATAIEDDGESRSSCSSQASPIFTSPEPSDGNQTQEGDRNSIYMQRRLRNNLAAKRSRDARRQREDHVAATCQRMEDIKQRLIFIRNEYIKLVHQA